MPRQCAASPSAWFVRRSSSTSWLGWKPKPPRTAASARSKTLLRATSIRCNSRERKSCALPGGGPPRTPITVTCTQPSPGGPRQPKRPRPAQRRGSAPWRGQPAEPHKRQVVTRPGGHTVVTELPGNSGKQGRSPAPKRRRTRPSPAKRQNRKLLEVSDGRRPAKVEVTVNAAAPTPNLGCAAVPTTCPEEEQNRVLNGHSRPAAPKAASLFPRHFALPEWLLVTRRIRARSDYESAALTG
jgi:hypothetical protein